MSFLQNLLMKLQNFMIGRNGLDQLNLFLLIFYFVSSIILDIFRLNNQFTKIIQLAILGIYLFRTFSKTLHKRRNENQKFLSVYNPIKNWIKRKINRLKKMKDYKYFKCPNCKSELRVPRGKGKITVTCPKCRSSFDKKS